MAKNLEEKAKEAAEKEAAGKEAAEKAVVKKDPNIVILKNNGARIIVLSRRPGFDQKKIHQGRTIELKKAELDARKGEATIAHMLETGELEVV